MKRIVKNHNNHCNLEFIGETDTRYSKIDWLLLDDFFHHFSPVLFDADTLDTMERYVYKEKLKALDIKMSIASQDYTTQKLLERDYTRIHQDFTILFRDYQKHQKTQKFLQLYIQIYIAVSNFSEKIINLGKTL